MASVARSATAAYGAGEQSCTLVNPTKRVYANELVRLLAPVPPEIKSVVVKEDGKEVASQLETIGGQTWIWICSNFAAGESHAYTVAPGNSKPGAKRVTVRKDGDSYVLDNGLVAVRVPAEWQAVGGKPLEGPAPILGLKVGEKWLGRSEWDTFRVLRHFTATVEGDGTLLGKIRLHYEFSNKAGLNLDQPAFAEIDIALGPDWKHVEIFERHEMGRDDAWEFVASDGWAPRDGLSTPFSRGAGSGEIAGKIEPNRRLLPGGLPLQKPELFINLFPRWNQHYKDGWSFLATDGKDSVGAVVVRASQWIWPHDNAIECLVKPSGEDARLRLSTWHGQRLWWLVGPTRDAASVDYVARYAWEGLDKLNHEFILDWPGHKGAFSGMNFYDGGMNPTSGLRGAGKAAIANADKEGDLGSLFRAQVMIHPDAYGSYANYWSPENCNFFTDFNKVPIGLIAGLRNHPRFEELRQKAEAKVREDLDHSVTLPGGAGQECPGYEAYALKNWGEEAAVCRKYLGFDPTTWPRYKAAESFLKRITQPDGAVRRMLPIGDTHPGKDGPTIVDVPADEVRRFTTEELPGFGVVFNNRAGTPRETYLAFKAGPNRGHYHGDQLSLHLCFDADAVAVDHHCSYHPRAGQEHMHNRVCFHTDDLPYANMDGYERLIAFKTSPGVDIAVGDVYSYRLRQVEKLPPELWDQRYPQHKLADLLYYRRTVVLVKGEPHDYFVIRDQYSAPENLSATYCLHALSDAIKQDGATVRFDNLTLYCAAPAKFEFDTLPWSHDNGGREATQGARLTIKGNEGEFVTVLYPGAAPTLKPIAGGVQVGGDRITFGGKLSEAAKDLVTIDRESQPAVTLAGAELNLNRSQGDIGLFVPDAGYPFGDIPDWLLRQRAGPRIR